MPIAILFHYLGAVWRRAAPATIDVVEARALTHPSPIELPSRLSAAAQWKRLSGVVEMAIASAEDARRLQTAATQQLDLAQYAISTLADELSAVMTIPGRREKAEVRILPSGLPASASRKSALAA